MHWLVPEPTQKYGLSYPRQCRQNWYQLRRFSISMHWLIPEPTQKYELSHPRPCRKSDFSWDGLQFLCIGLCRSLLKSMSYPISDHAEQLILAERVFNFYASSCAEACCNSVLVFGCCLDPLVNTRSLFPLQITSVWTPVCKSILLHSAYWSPRSKCARRIWAGILRVVISREVFQKRCLRAIGSPLTTICILTDFARQHNMPMILVCAAMSSADNVVEDPVCGCQ